MPDALLPGAPEPEIDAVEAYDRVRAVLADRDAARASEASILVASLRAAAPELDDQWALFAADLERLAGARPETCARYEEATTSPLPSVALEARVGRAHCLLEVGDRHAEEELATLVRRYPELPGRVGLELARARMHERAGDVRGAVAGLRAIDLEHPGAPEAVVAREALAALLAGGARVPAFSPLEELARADRLVRSGPPDLARTEVDRLLATRLPVPQAAELRLLAARLARVEGRFDDARGLMREARGLEPAVGEDPEAVAAAAADLEAAALRSDEEARAELRSMGFGRGMRRASATRLYLMSRVAARTGLREELATILDELIRRVAQPEGLSCVVRQDTAIIAAGSDDARVAQLLDGCDTLLARFHRARALERSGQTRAARDAYRAVIETDDSDTGFYALWSRTRLGAIGDTDAPPPTEVPVAAAADVPPSEPEHRFESLHVAGGADAELELAMPTIDAISPTLTPILWTPRADRWSLTDGMLGDGKLGEVAGEIREPPVAPGPALRDVPVLREAITAEGELAESEPEMLEPELGETLTDQQVLQVLGRLASTYAEGLPWIGRARARLTLGDRIGAAEELFQAWAAWRESTGSAPIRAGAEAVYRGAAPARIPVDIEARRGRRALSAADREHLADVAAHLGDHGLAARFGGPERVAMRPRPYADLVRAAAERHHLDPNLIWAVMRVESVYNPSIVSYAGAIGLLQIMPRTGRLIANALGRTDFTTADLLDPATNIEFGAWYLRSLLDRFEGRVALAIAAYNGGPHNVRRWMAEHSPSMPVDALCERIPFTQTYRYVRRVLHHYTAYRAADGLGLPELLPTLPGAAVDTVAF